VRSDFTNNTSVCVEPETFLFTDDGKFPNSKLPLLVYRQAVQGDGADPAAAFEHCFAINDWTNSWRNGVYPFMHYHSTSAEVLGVYRGSAQIRVGGEQSQTLKVAAGDVIVIPAGVPHQNVGSSPDFGVVGAYPEGRGWDVLRGLEGERPQADRKIAHLPIPKNDPLYGANGPLKQLWISA
jgi:uncharacterized protein YjlB